MNTDVAKPIVLAKAALFALYQEYAAGGGFSMDRYTSIEKYINDALEAAGVPVRRFEPNPCKEILLGGTRI